MATSEHWTVVDVRSFLTCCKCRSFLPGYKIKYIVLCVYMCTYMHTYIQVPQTHVNTDTLRNTNEKKLFCVFAPTWYVQWAAGCGAAPVSWAGLLPRLGNGSTDTNWAGTSPQPSLWELSWAHLQEELVLAYLACCFCLVWLFHVLTTLGPDRGCSCMISPNWPLWHWLHCKYYKSEQL